MIFRPATVEPLEASDVTLARNIFAKNNARAVRVYFFVKLEAFKSLRIDLPRWALLTAYLRVHLEIAVSLRWEMSVEMHVTHVAIAPICLEGTRHVASARYKQECWAGSMTPENTETGFRGPPDGRSCLGKRDKGFRSTLFHGSKARRSIRAILCERDESLKLYDSVNASMTLRKDAKEKNHEFRGRTRRSFLKIPQSIYFSMMHMKKWDIESTQLLGFSCSLHISSARVGFKWEYLKHRNLTLKPDEMFLNREFNTSYITLKLIEEIYKKLLHL